MATLSRSSHATHLNHRQHRACRVEWYRVVSGCLLCCRGVGGGNEHSRLGVDNEREHHHALSDVRKQIHRLSHSLECPLCVTVCIGWVRHTPMPRDARCASMASRGALELSLSLSSMVVQGNCHMPARRPVSLRFSTRKDSAPPSDLHDTMHTAHSSSRTLVLGGCTHQRKRRGCMTFGGKRIGSVRPRQTLARGHSPQRGCAGGGRHTMAPSSIRP